MEDRMELAICRKDELVGHNLELTVKTGSELFGRPAYQGLLSVRMKFEENPIINLKATLNLVLVNLLLHTVLGDSQMIPEVAQESVAILQRNINQIVGSSTRYILLNCGRRSAIHSLKRRHLNGGVNCGVVPPFSPMEEIDPSRRLVTDEAT